MTRSGGWHFPEALDDHRVHRRRRRRRPGYGRQRSSGGSGTVFSAAAIAAELARGTVQQLLLPVVDLVRMDPELTRQLGDRPVPPDRRQPTFALNAALCFFRVRFMSCSCDIRAF